jgi:hypothetical protein
MQTLPKSIFGDNGVRAMGRCDNYAIDQSAIDQLRVAGKNGDRRKFLGEEISFLRVGLAEG